MKKILFAFLLVKFCISYSQLQKISTWEEAKSIAEKENKNILIEFTGSNWCKPCIKMEKEVINTNEFESFAKNKLVLFVLDLQMPMNINSDNYIYFYKFKTKYKVSKFPTYILVDKNGAEIKRLEGKYKLETFIKKLEIK